MIIPKTPNGCSGELDKHDLSLTGADLLLPESFWSLAPDCLLVLSAEFLVDWIKHAFITRFNEVSAEVYKDYTTYLAYDLAQTKQKYVRFFAPILTQRQIVSSVLFVYNFKQIWC